MTVELVDMCSLQTPQHVDFNLMKEAGVRGVYFCSSRYSSSVDYTFDEGVEKAMRAGLVCGAYHFAFCGSDPEKQMEFFYKQSSKLGQEANQLPPMLDWEFSVNGTDGQPIKKSDSVIWALKAMDAMWNLWYSLGVRRPTLYTFPYFAAERQPWLGMTPELSAYPLTLAAYPTIGKQIPRPWTKATIHQYIGNGGRVPGVKVDCDRDRFLGSEDDFQRFIGNTVTPGSQRIKSEAETGSGPVIHPFDYEWDTGSSSGAV